MDTILGLDIGGTKTAVVEGSYEGDILQRLELQTQADLPVLETFPRIVDRIHQVMDASPHTIDGISISIGGPLRIKEGVLIDPPHLMGWHGFRLKEHLSTLFPAIPVYVEHDGNAGALAEFYFGAGKDRDDIEHLIFLTFGTGAGQWPHCKQRRCIWSLGHSRRSRPSTVEQTRTCRVWQSRIVGGAGLGGCTCRACGPSKSWAVDPADANTGRCGRHAER